MDICVEFLCLDFGLQVAQEIPHLLSQQWGSVQEVQSQFNHSCSRQTCGHGCQDEWGDVAAAYSGAAAQAAACVAAATAEGWKLKLIKQHVVVPAGS